MFSVTVDAFSGRPNPTYVIGDDESREFLRDLPQAAISDTATRFDGLGFRGVVVETYRFAPTDINGLRDAINATSRWVVAVANITGVALTQSTLAFAGGDSGLTLTLADWQAAGADGQLRASGTNVFAFDAGARIASVVGLWN